MKLEVNLNKNYVYAILGSIIVVLGIIAVAAFNTNNPSVFGHSPGEIAPGTFGGSSTGSSDYYFPASIFLGNTNKEGAIVLAGSIPEKHIYFRNLAGSGILQISDDDGDYFFANDSDLVIPSGNGIILGGVRRDSWPTSTSGGTSGYISGMHCGVRSASTDSAVLNVQVNCGTHNPQVSCPSGFVRAGGDYQTSGNRYFYTCVCNQASCTAS